MEAAIQAQVAFYLTGKRSAPHLEDALDLRPLLFAGFRDLSRLRHDFPLVLAADGQVHALSALMDSALAALPGNDGERLRQHLLRLETAIRSLAGAGGSLGERWQQATERLDPDALLADSLARSFAALPLDGQLAACDAALPARLLCHAWQAVEARKARAFHLRLERLAKKLADILQADFERSAAARSPAHLQGAVGGSFRQAFDFQAFSTLLEQSLPRDALPDSRTRRIRQLLEVFATQRFFPAAAGTPHSFLFDSCAQALAAWQQRLPELMALARAMALAELEIDGQYDPARHDALFEHFGAQGLEPEELAAFPAYLVRLNAANLDDGGHGRLMETLGSGLPIKVLLQIDDLQEAAPACRPAAGARCRTLASMVMGLGEVYVLQTASSHLYRYRQHLQKGLEFSGPALFSVYSGAGNPAVPPYLMAAAAMESRAFPAFCFDPAAGPDWASRFDLVAIGQMERDWPTHPIVYADETEQRIRGETAFTLVDFLACDRRNAPHLARVPRRHWGDSLIPVDEFLRHPQPGMPDKLPSLLMVDADDQLQRVIPDQALLRQARRCHNLWHSLQELAGVHNSHAERCLADARQAWQENGKEQAPPAVAPAETPAASAPPEAPPAPSPDTAWIETPRCSTCNECVQRNDKLFAYDANRQAYIADIKAGTYAQLVEAAENCKLSIIHPGKPTNPLEPGLEALSKRAEMFL